jgi:hypothetical protein
VPGEGIFLKNIVDRINRALESALVAKLIRRDFTINEPTRHSGANLVAEQLVAAMMHARMTDVKITPGPRIRTW